MRRITAVFFLLIYLFANTELHELAKISAFITHYREHQGEDKDITLVKFIKIHYFNGNLVDDDHDKDMQLPFKVVDCSISGATHIIPLPFGFVIYPNDAFEIGRLPIYDQSALPALHLSDIWQPPKVC